jgi:RNA polymerase sigma-70 factor (ECF subfamily)
MEEERMLVQRCLDGDTRAFDRLYESYRGPCYVLALQWVGRKEDALDIMQTAFIKAFKQLSSFDTSRSFRPWLFTILRNQSIDCLRKRGRKKRESIGERDFAHQGPGPLRVVEASDTQQVVRAALDDLKEDHREIILLKDFHEMKYREISEALDIPMGTVMSRLNSARKSLREKLKGKL